MPRAYSTEFMGRQVLYREVECQSMGQPACRIVGKPADEWGEEGQRRTCSYLMPTALRADSGHADTRPAVRIRASPPAYTGAADQPVGISPGYNSVLHMVQRVAPTSATVLFLGESGVGKEVFARMLHG